MQGHQRHRVLPHLGPPHHQRDHRPGQARRVGLLAGARGVQHQGALVIRAVGATGGETSGGPPTQALDHLPLAGRGQIDQVDLPALVAAPLHHVLEQQAAPRAGLPGEEDHSPRAGALQHGLQGVDLRVPTDDPDRRGVAEQRLGLAQRGVERQQGGLDLGGGGGAARGVLSQQRRHQLGDAVGDPAHHPRQLGRRGLELEADQLLGLLRLEGPAPGQEAEEQHPQAVEIRPGVHRAPDDLLRRRIGPGADELPGPDHRLGLVQREHGAEVDQLHPPVAQHQQVGALDVAVHQPPPVGVAQGSAGAQGHPQRGIRPLGRPRPPHRPHVDLGGHAAQQLHRHVGAPVRGGAKAVDAHHIPMVQPREGPILTAKALLCHPRAVQQLEGAAAAGLRILHLIDRGRATAGQPADHP